VVSVRAELDKMKGVLTARERGVLVLRSMKSNEPEDPLWRLLMPQDQVEFNRYIDLMNACNLQGAFLITVIEMNAEKLTIRWAWLLDLEMWEFNVHEIDFTASAVVRESITESEHRKVLDREAKRYVPLAELALELAEWERAWADGDLEPLGYWKDNRVIKDEAWIRLCKDAGHRLLVAALGGDLDSRGKAANLSIRRGSFEAWLGRQPKAHPEWAPAYEVVPDDRWAQAAADRKTLAHLKDAIERSPMQRMHAEVRA
jgi:hypothetical protein